VKAGKTRSGANIPERQRTTVQVKLRLDVDVAEDLDELAERWGMKRSEAVARMLEGTLEGMRRQLATQHKSDPT
jgi:metal-responsive CopG/Arc/MetJ family transcriptional regulator